MTKESERIRDERAGQEAADPDRLLPGEDPATSYADDAQKWIEVYDELLRFKSRLLEVAEETLKDVHGKPARHEVVETDKVVLETEVNRFRNRLAFWRKRLSELDRNGEARQRG
jgi:hypothetical protein